MVLNFDLQGYGITDFLFAKLKSFPGTWNMLQPKHNKFARLKRHDSLLDWKCSALNNMK